MLVSADNLVEFIKAIFIGAGSTADEAVAVAENLVGANLRGHDSHGVQLVPRYVEHALDGRVNPGQSMTVTRDTGPIVQLDGNMGYGQVNGPIAMKMGIAKAGEYGVAVVALRNTHHLGRIGAWGEMCAEAGFVSMHWVNATGHFPLVAPFGAIDARYTTNPYCTAFPATDEHPPLVLDMATSAIAMGKVVVAHNRGEPVRDGALIDADGNPTNDPGVMFQEDAAKRGALLPVGTYKGYGLALVCEMLAGALVNNGTCLPAREAENSIVNGMLTVILDPAAIGDAEIYRRERDAMTTYVKQARPAPGFGAVMVPGDPERKALAERGAGGIPVDDTTWNQILETAAKLGINADSIDAMVGA